MKRVFGQHKYGSTRGSNLTLASMASGTSQGGAAAEIVRSDAPIKKSGYLKKIKTNKKKFFILREDSAKYPAQLEYYDSEKKYRSGHQPGRTVTLKDCFSINRKQVAKHKNVFALYVHEHTLVLQADTEEDLRDWLNNLHMLQHGGTPTETTSGINEDQPKPEYECDWDVDVQAKDVGKRAHIEGRYRLCLVKKLFSTPTVPSREEYSLRLIKSVSPSSSSVITNSEEVRHSMEFPFRCIRCIGSHAAFVMIELGRDAVTGEGKLWMLAEDDVLAKNIHETVDHLMQGRERGAQSQTVLLDNNAATTASGSTTQQGASAGGDTVDSSRASTVTFINRSQSSSHVSSSPSPQPTATTFVSHHIGDSPAAADEDNDDTLSGAACVVTPAPASAAAAASLLSSSHRSRLLPDFGGQPHALLEQQSSMIHHTQTNAAAAMIQQHLEQEQQQQVPSYQTTWLQQQQQMHGANAVPAQPNMTPSPSSLHMSATAQPAGNNMRSSATSYSSSQNNNKPASGLYYDDEQYMPMEPPKPAVQLAVGASAGSDVDDYTPMAPAGSVHSSLNSPSLGSRHSSSASSTQHSHNHTHRHSKRDQQLAGHSLYDTTPGDAVSRRPLAQRQTSQAPAEPDDSYVEMGFDSTVTSAVPPSARTRGLSSPPSSASVTSQHLQQRGGIADVSSFLATYQQQQQHNDPHPMQDQDEYVIMRPSSMSSTNSSNVTPASMGGGSIGRASNAHSTTGHSGGRHQSRYAANAIKSGGGGTGSGVEEDDEYLYFGPAGAAAVGPHHGQETAKLSSSGSQKFPAPSDNEAYLDMSPMGLQHSQRGFSPTSSVIEHHHHHHSAAQQIFSDPRAILQSKRSKQHVHQQPPIAALDSTDAALIAGATESEYMPMAPGRVANMPSSRPMPAPSTTSGGRATAQGAASTVVGMLHHQTSRVSSSLPNDESVTYEQPRVHNNHSKQQTKAGGVGSGSATGDVVRTEDDGNYLSMKPFSTKNTNSSHDLDHYSTADGTNDNNIALSSSAISSASSSISIPNMSGTSLYQQSPLANNNSGSRPSDARPLQRLPPHAGSSSSSARLQQQQQNLAPSATASVQRSVAGSNSNQMLPPDVLAQLPTSDPQPPTNLVHKMDKVQSFLRIAAQNNDQSLMRGVRAYSFGSPDLSRPLPMPSHGHTHAQGERQNDRKTSSSALPSSSSQISNADAATFYYNDDAAALGLATAADGLRISQEQEQPLPAGQVGAAAIGSSSANPALQRVKAAHPSLPQQQQQQQQHQYALAAYPVPFQRARAYSLESNSKERMRGAANHKHSKRYTAVLNAGETAPDTTVPSGSRMYARAADASFRAPSFDSIAEAVPSSPPFDSSVPSSASSMMTTVVAPPPSELAGNRMLEKNGNSPDPNYLPMQPASTLSAVFLAKTSHSDDGRRSDNSTKPPVMLEPFVYSSDNAARKAENADPDFMMLEFDGRRSHSSAHNLPPSQHSSDVLTSMGSGSALSTSCAPKTRHERVSSLKHRSSAAELRLPTSESLAALRSDISPRLERHTQKSDQRRVPDSNTPVRQRQQRPLTLATNAELQTGRKILPSTFPESSSDAPRQTSGGDFDATLDDGEYVELSTSVSPSTGNSNRSRDAAPRYVSSTSAANAIASRGDNFMPSSSSSRDPLVRAGSATGSFRAEHPENSKSPQHVYAGSSNDGTRQSKPSPQIMLPTTDINNNGRGGGLLHHHTSYAGADSTGPGRPPLRHGTSHELGRPPQLPSRHRADDGRGEAVHIARADSLMSGPHQHHTQSRAHGTPGSSSGAGNSVVGTPGNDDGEYFDMMPASVQQQLLAQQQQQQQQQQQPAVVHERRNSSASIRSNYQKRPPRQQQQIEDNDDSYMVMNMTNSQLSMDSNRNASRATDSPAINDSVSRAFPPIGATTALQQRPVATHEGTDYVLDPNVSRELLYGINSRQTLSDLQNDPYQVAGQRAARRAREDAAAALRNTNAAVVAALPNERTGDESGTAHTTHCPTPTSASKSSTAVAASGAAAAQRNGKQRGHNAAAIPAAASSTRQTADYMEMAPMDFSGGGAEIPAAEAYELMHPGGGVVSGGGWALDMDDSSDAAVMATFGSGISHSASMDRKQQLGNKRSSIKSSTGSWKNRSSAMPIGGGGKTAKSSKHDSIFVSQSPREETLSEVGGSSGKLHKRKGSFIIERANTMQGGSLTTGSRYLRKSPTLESIAHPRERNPGADDRTSHDYYAAGSNVGGRNVDIMPGNFAPMLMKGPAMSFLSTISDGLAAITGRTQKAVSPSTSFADPSDAVSSLAAQALKNTVAVPAAAIAGEGFTNAAASSASASSPLTPDMIFSMNIHNAPAETTKKQDRPAFSSASAPQIRSSNDVQQQRYDTVDPVESPVKVILNNNAQDLPACAGPVPFSRLPHTLTPPEEQPVIYTSVLPVQLHTSSSRPTSTSRQSSVTSSHDLAPSGVQDPSRVHEMRKVRVSSGPNRLHAAERSASGTSGSVLGTDSSSVLDGTTTANTGASTRRISSGGTLSSVQRADNSNYAEIGGAAARHASVSSGSTVVSSSNIVHTQRKSADDGDKVQMSLARGALTALKSLKPRK